MQVCIHVYFEAELGLQIEGLSELECVQGHPGKES